MFELTVLSGKGGTGKTSVTAALTYIAENVVVCDNDVDAADMHLILSPQIEQRYVFDGAWQPRIDTSMCTGCGICADACRYDAIHYNKDGSYRVNLFQCEGCRLCERLCRVGAISSERSKNNHWFVSNTRVGQLVHAKMGPGEENSGKLVAVVRRKAKEIAKATGINYVINDGPPGIGCTAISSITGTDRVLLVIEPSCSGWHDAKRVIDLVNGFSIPIYALINKYDIAEDMSMEIEHELDEMNIPLLAKLPFDNCMVEAMINEQTIVEFLPNHEISKLLQKAWHKIVSMN